MADPDDPVPTASPGREERWRPCQPVEVRSEVPPLGVELPQVLPEVPRNPNRCFGQQMSATVEVAMKHCGLPLFSCWMGHHDVSSFMNNKTESVSYWSSTPHRTYRTISMTDSLLGR